MRMPLNWSSLKRMPLNCSISYYSTVTHECTINEGFPCTCTLDELVAFMEHWYKEKEDKRRQRSVLAVPFMHTTAQKSAK